MKASQNSFFFLFLWFVVIFNEIVNEMYSVINHHHQLSRTDLQSLVSE